MRTKSLSFRFSGKMARLLGRESVSSDVAALFELVKNGYDADADKVVVTFENFQPNFENGRIIVTDINGDGMTLDDIENKWLVIGTDTKERCLFTRRKNRRVIGNKGVGRFSTEKLCNFVTIVTRPLDSEEEIKIMIDWEQYEKPNITFNDVENKIEIYNRIRDADPGTTIILQKLRENWTVEKIQRLRELIGAIILPTEIKKMKNDSFSVEVHAHEFPLRVSPEIQSTLLKNAPYEIRAIILNNQTEYRVNIYKGKELEYSERVDLSDVIMETGEKWRSFGKCSLRIFMFPDKSIYEDWTEHYKKALNTKDITQLLESVRGVKIYRDGFWVRPYGEPGDDWLGLERERVQANFKVGNSQIVGFVEITKDDNPSIIDTTTRERVVENTEFQCMRTFVKEAIDVMSYHRREVNKKLREKKIKIEHKNVIEHEIDLLKKSVSGSSNITSQEKKDITKALNSISRVFNDFQGVMEETTERLQISERAYRNLAALGISSATTAHEIGRIIGHAELIPSKVINKLKKHPEVESLIGDDVERIKDKMATVKYFMAFVINFVESLTYDNRIKHKKETIDVNKELTKMFADFSGIMKATNLKLDWKTSPDKILIHMNKADFESILLNLLSNSLKAVRMLPENVSKKVKITITSDANTFKIKFSDNGYGVKDENREKIFRLFFTTTKNGTGLGLPIIQEILEDYSGSIELKPYSEIDNGATFVIKIPMEELKE